MLHLGSNLIAWLGDNASSASEHHLEVLGLDIEVASASLAETSALGCSEEAGTSFWAVAEVGLRAVDAACVSCVRIRDDLE